MAWVTLFLRVFMILGLMAIGLGTVTSRFWKLGISAGTYDYWWNAKGVIAGRQAVSDWGIYIDNFDPFPDRSPFLPHAFNGKFLENWIVFVPWWLVIVSWVGLSIVIWHWTKRPVQVGHGFPMEPIIEARG